MLILCFQVQKLRSSNMTTCLQRPLDIDCCGRGIFHETKLYIRCASEHHEASVEAANHCSSCRGCVHLAESICNIRAIAAGPVSLVSTGPLFPIALPISAIARRTPKQDPKYISDMLKLAKWPLFTVRKNSSESSNNCSSKQTL